MDGTVSVSTVMFWVETSVRDLIVDNDEDEAFGERVLGRCTEADRRSCILPLATLCSLPLSCLDAFALRSSVTLVDVTSFRSSSADLWA
jgi:hypothetical protein